MKFSLWRKKKNVMVQFEAAVAGGIPIIKALREGLAANQIRSIAGIINGTSNFILTEMREKGSAFADVLKEAQALGYAEADPTFDIEGHDAGHKITIMSALAFGTPMNFSACYLEGIRNSTAVISNMLKSLAIASNCWVLPVNRQRHRVACTPYSDS